MQREVPLYVQGGSVLACVLLFGISAQRRKWRTLLGMFVLLIALAGGVSSCGGGGGGGGKACTNVVIAGTTPGAYTVKVTGTSDAITETGFVTLTVQ